MYSVVLLVEKILSFGETSKDPEQLIYLDVEEFPYLSSFLLFIGFTSSTPNQKENGTIL